MISFDKALEIVLTDVPLVQSERIDFKDTLNRVLFEDIVSDIDMPPFNKSAMDGYACKMKDIRKDLQVIEIIPAGKVPVRKIDSGQCAKIMTGAIIPEGADWVVKIEDTKTINENIIRVTKETKKPNIAIKGENMQVGHKVLRKGILIQPQHIAVMATVGCVTPLVSAKVKIGIISTGDEIVEADNKPGASQIRNSNGPQLYAQTLRINAHPNYYGITGDSEEESFKIINKALAENNIVLLTGGVSMGDFDFIPYVMEQIGIDLKFKTVAIQPGKPTVFGSYQDKRIFGLPGNPISAFNTFELFVKPLTMKMMGWTDKPMMIKLPMGRTYIRNKAIRTSWVPINIHDDGKVYPIEYLGSAHVNALVIAQGIIAVPYGETKIREGELVYVRPV